MKPSIKAGPCAESPPGTDFSGWQIHIIGEMLFQNSLLASVLSRKFRIPCYSQSRPEAGMLQSCDRNLILFDLRGQDGIGEISMRIANVFGRPGPACLFALFNTCPKTPCCKEAVLSAGIRGIFFENESVDTFFKGIAAILGGNHWFPRQLLNQWIGQSAGPGGAGAKSAAVLTRREKEILRMVAAGASNGEISEKMYISYHTVKTHLSNIYRKIEVANRLQATLWSARHL